MKSFNLIVVGDAKELKSLEGFCTRRGISVQHLEIALNSLDAEHVAKGVVCAFQIIAGFGVILKQITEWRSRRKATFRYFSPEDRGHIEVVGEQAIKKAVKSGLINIVRSKPPRQKQKKRERDRRSSSKSGIRKIKRSA